MAEEQPRGFGYAARETINKATRKANREKLAAYHQEQLSRLQDRVRSALAECEAGRMDAFDVDSVIRHYTLAAKQLWSFCAGESNEKIAYALRVLEFSQEQGVEQDWWALPERLRRRG